MNSSIQPGLMPRNIARPLRRRLRTGEQQRLSDGVSNDLSVYSFRHNRGDPRCDFGMPIKSPRRYRFFAELSLRENPFLTSDGIDSTDSLSTSRIRGVVHPRCAWVG